MSKRDIFPQSLTFQEPGQSGLFKHTRLDFPVILANTSKRLIQELIGWEIDNGFINQPPGAGNNNRLIACLSLAEQTDAQTGTNASGLDEQTIGDVNVIDRFMVQTVSEVGSTPTLSMASPVFRSLMRGGVGTLLPQNHIFVNTKWNSDTANVPIGVRIWYRQRTVDDSEFLGLLASRTQLGVG